MQHQHRTNDKSIDFNTGAREYAVIADAVEPRYGEHIAKLLRKDRMASTPPNARAQVGAARIDQLEEMQKRPQAMASRWVDSVLR